VEFFGPGMRGTSASQPRTACWHALLLPGREQLDEALAVDTTVGLVNEAARFLEA
jgi:hypothetical protein